MEGTMKRTLVMAATVLTLIGAPAVADAVFVQCPTDLDGDGIPPRHLNDSALNPAILDGDDPAGSPTVKCIHLTGGDGWVTMGDGREVYVFGFSDVSAIDQSEVLAKGIFRANSPAPTIRIREGDELYITLSNVGTHNRPDLFDPHSVHYHGFPNSSSIFDGLPESGLAVVQQASITYYYNNQEPGTYMWHCHVEATEHMQMGMLGNLYVEPLQNQTGIGGTLASPHLPTRARLEGGPAGAPLGYVYNDGDGSTAYDVEYAVQLQAIDHNFHDASRDTQVLPFADMRDTYPTLNGRGYPHTKIVGALHNCGAMLPGGGPVPCPADHPDGDEAEQDSSQPVSTRITATAGQRLLLRLSNLGVVRHYTVTALGLPMRVVGHGARLLRGPSGLNVAYDTNVVTLGGGESADIIINTTGVAPGTYFLYTTNLNYLSNNQEDFGGVMAEITIN